MRAESDNSSDWGFWFWMGFRVGLGWTGRNDHILTHRGRPLGANFLNKEERNTVWTSQMDGPMGWLAGFFLDIRCLFCLVFLALLSFLVQRFLGLLYGNVHADIDGHGPQDGHGTSHFHSHSFIYVHTYFLLSASCITCISDHL